MTPTRTHSTKVPGWVAAVTCGGVLLRVVFAVGWVLLIKLLPSPAIPPRHPLPAVAIGNHAVYEVTGSPEEADVFALGPGGQQLGDDFASLPLEPAGYTFGVQTGDDLFVDATYRDGPGTLTCRIMLNGEVMVAETKDLSADEYRSGRLLHVSCEVRVP